jgi:glutamyl-tRNA reductase
MEELRQAELRRMQGKLQSLSAEQRSIVDALTRGLINKVLHQPLQAMKAAARSGDLKVVDAVQQIFGLPSQGAGLAQRGPAPQQEIAGETAVEPANAEAVEAARPLETARH